MTLKPLAIIALSLAGHAAVAAQESADGATTADDVPVTDADHGEEVDACESDVDCPEAHECFGGACVESFVVMTDEEADRTESYYHDAYCAETEPASSASLPPTSLCVGGTPSEAQVGRFIKKVIGILVRERGTPRWARFIQVNSNRRGLFRIATKPINDGSEYIAKIEYHPGKVARLLCRQGGTWAAMFAVAHEVAHVELAHMPRGREWNETRRHEFELFCDESAAARLFDLGANESDVLSFFWGRELEPRSEFHPKNAHRIAVVADAWRAARARRRLSNATRAAIREGTLLELARSGEVYAESLLPEAWRERVLMVFRFGSAGASERYNRVIPASRVEEIFRSLGDAN